MAIEENKSYAEKNEERVEKAIDKIEDALTDDQKDKPEIKSKSSSDNR